MTIYRSDQLLEVEVVVEIKRWIIIFLICGIMMLVAVYGLKFIASRNSIAKEIEVRQHLTIGMDIEAARTQLESNGFHVSEIELRSGLGTKVMLVKLVENTSFDFLEYGMEADLTPFSAEPRHWVVVKTSPGSNKIASVESK